MVCSVCQQTFDPEQPSTDPATEAGLFLTRELYGNAGDLCPQCLVNRGMLGMMYCRDFD